ncbi:hypothetical protein BASA50_006567 [Batrachochytrium salamandrivorans]|uniref:t-SNARE coiled-coil homology domain-containing protein n=1 Tax=Batrachochytrium salamandrivorans TaxID=1357716 RepID=A0ABQ8F9T4_9FUNG|nr:hypothetical protein BASA61_008322 [Batrachochytrium salamandrivorans]KAH6594618.1 hypothetical protein BASA50_006567 [Batrachochytrium salamandrivorans]KAH9252510.1 hypothetical protein BASA81_009553 [Batrachochytrium salamandrivorans]
MRDRMQDLQPEGQTESSTPIKKEKTVKKKKNEKVEADTTKAMQEFFEELALVKDNIALVRSSIDEIKSIHDKALNNVISEQQNAQIAKELDATMDKTNRVSGEIRNKLKDIDAENKSQQKKDPSSNDVKIRISQHGVLTRNFLEVMMEYKKTQETYQDKYKDRMHRQCLVVKPNATNQEIEQMMDGEKSQMFAKQIVNTGQRQEARKALEDIQSKHKDVVKIEKSILELQQLFIDMAVLVASQGEIIDQIAVHIDNAANDTEQGTQSLAQATKLQKKSRKKMCIIIIFIVVGVVLVVAIPSLLKGFKFF